MTQKLVVIGNGMAPGRMLEKLVENNANGFEITVFNAEPRVNYNRLMLSHVLSGEKSYDDIITHDDTWYHSNRVTLHKGLRVTRIDRQKRQVECDDGRIEPYNKLVIATGSSPVMLPLPGNDLPGVMVYRDLDDVEGMIDAAGTGGRAVVIGGGLLGLEAAAGLHAQGMQVTVIHLMDSLMERQLDASAAYLLKKSIEDRGITVLTGSNTKKIVGGESVTGVLLDDGTELPAEIVVMAVGIRPASQLAKDAGLEVNRGIVVDDTLHTSDEDIFALGECVEHDGQCYGLVAPLYDMAKVLADNLISGNSRYTGSVTATKLKVSGIDLYSAGDIEGNDETQEIVLRDATAGVYKRIVLNDNRVVGAVLYGETTDGAWFFDLLKKTD